MKNKKTKFSKENYKSCYVNEIVGILLICFGLIVGVSVYLESTGMAGLYVKRIVLGSTGIFAFLVPIAFVFIGIVSIFRGIKISIYKIITALALLMISMFINHIIHIENFNLTDMLSFSISSYDLGRSMIGSGVLFSPLIYWLYILLGRIASLIFLFSLFFILFLILTGLSLGKCLVRMKNIFISLHKVFTGSRVKKPQSITSGNKPFKGESIKSDEIKARVPDILPLDQVFEFGDKNVNRDLIEPKYSSNSVLNAKQQNLKAGDSKDDNKIDTFDHLSMNTGVLSYYGKYAIPPLSILRSSSGKKLSKPQDKDVLTNAKLLEETLTSFGITAKVINVSKGPAITRYELQPAPGIKVSRIVSLSNDIALSLAARAVRIEAPIPGKSAIGIEIPNQDVTPVLLREVIESDEFVLSQSNLMVGLGKDIAGNNIVTDLARMPHLLIAGATGSGKSVCVNTLIVSVLYKASPESVKMLMIDPKVVELNHYNGIPHLIIPVVTDTRKAAGALSWAVQEMNNRYKLFAEKGARDLERFNSLQEKSEDMLPQILVIIDELADLMMVAPAEVEDSICRLAQMARAAGIHLIIATQRPSVDVITGVIKANIPSRISFAVSSQIDSRTILDMGGAEKLLGRGDMLFYPTGLSKPIRIQGSFVSEKEVEAVVNFVKEQNRQPKYNEAIEEEINASFDSNISKDSDELLPQAIEIAIDLGHISISMIQRRLRVGYARAARLVDSMEARGIVSGADGSKPRNILVNKDYLKSGKGGT